VTLEGKFYNGTRTESNIASSLNEAPIKGRQVAFLAAAI